MKTIQTSTEISVLDFAVLLDISTQNQQITLTNNSTAALPAGLKWAFEIYSPSGTAVHKGDLSLPDATGGWTTPFVQASGFPRPFNQVEWGTYRVVVSVRDAAGSVFTDEKSVNLCRPSGCEPSSPNPFGAARCLIQTRCQTAQLWVEDSTAYSYQGRLGAAVTKTLTVTAPADDTGTVPPPVTLTGFSSGLIPIQTSGEGYQYFQTSIMDYDLGERVTVRLKYLGRGSFAVHCGLDITPLACDIRRLIDSIENGTCEDRTEAARKLEVINPKFSLALTGILYPQACIDPWKLVEEIKVVGGFECNCAPSGINRLTPVAANNLAYNLVASGDTTGAFTIEGSTITLTLKDFSYVVKVADASPSKAVSITAATEGQLKTYSVSLDQAALAAEIITVLEGSSALRNRLNALITVQAGAMSVDVNGGCVLKGATSSDYTLASAPVASGRTLLLNYLSVNGGKRYLNFNFDRQNAAALQTALNALQLGTFTVAFGGDNVLLITSTANPNEITGLNALNSGAVVAEEFTVTRKTATTSSYKVSEVLQALIDFVCATTLSKVTNGTALTVATLDKVGGTVGQKELLSTDTSLNLITAFLKSFNQLVTIVQGIKDVSADNLRGAYNPASGEILEDDVLHGTKGDEIAGLSWPEVAARILKLAQTDAQVKAEFCKAAAACAAPTCSPVQNAVASWAAGQGLKVDITNTGAARYRVGYRTTGSNTGLLGVEEVAAAVGTTTTKQWASVPAGAYDVVITALCLTTESTPYTASTLPCARPASLQVAESGGYFALTVGTLPAGAQKVRVEIDYPNGGTFRQNLPATPNPVQVLKPSGVYGTFVFRVRTVCDEAQSWYSPATADVTLAVAAPDSCPVVTNLTLGAVGLDSVSITAQKPVVGTTPNTYTLRLTNQRLGSTRAYPPTSAAGSTLTWNLGGLDEGTEYAYEVVSVCGDGLSRPVNGGRFTTLVNQASNSLINNSSMVAASSVTVMVDGLVVFSSGELAAQGVVSFYLPDYAYAEVRLTVCGVAPTFGSLSTGSGGYWTADQIQGDTLVFSAAYIKGGATFNFNNA